MVRGTRLHEDCENYVKGKLMVVPWELKKVALRLEDLKQKGAAAEETWLLDKYWKHDDEKPWIKAIIDVHYFEPGGKVLHVTDYKSGREYPEHRDQLELYGLIGLCRFPEVNRVEYQALYLDSGHTSNDGAILRGAVMDNKVKKWTDRAIRIFEDKEYRPNPGGACRFCDYNGKRGGPCSAGV
jgi:PD-(D/E)XK nuclease superfamily protein